MHKLMLAVLGSAVLSAVNCYAFDSVKCHEILFRVKDKGSLGTRLSTGSSSSSSSFTSSTGACKAVGLNERRQEFLFAHRAPLMRESTRGGGEYVDSFAKLSGCEDEAAAKHFGEMLQQRFDAIYFTGDHVATDADIASRVGAEILASPKLTSACKVSG